MSPIKPPGIINPVQPSATMGLNTVEMTSPQTNPQEVRVNETSMRTEKVKLSS